MADDPSERGAAIRSRINVNEDYELRYWSSMFGVTPDKLKVAVSRVGPMVDDVARELGKSRVNRGERR